MSSLPVLNSVSITFNTHAEDGRDSDTILHVFLKNRTSDTYRSENASDYISNHLAYQAYAAADPYTFNPYLASRENASAGVAFANPSSNTFWLTLRSKPIPCEEILLPVVNIHILPQGNDTWVFDYEVTLYFGDPNNSADPNHAYDFSFSSNINGVTGIVLSQDNRNYVGIGQENQNGIARSATKPVVDSVLTKVVLSIQPQDGTMLAATALNVGIVNRLNASTSQAMVTATNVFAGQALAPASPPQAFSVAFPSANTPLASSSINLADIVLPVVNISMAPGAGQGSWRFDYRVSYYFSYSSFPFALRFDSTTTGIVLNATETTCTDIYQGDSFPSLAPVGATLTAGAPIDHSTSQKPLSVDLLHRKFAQLINNRQGVDPQSASPAILKIQLQNEGLFEVTTPANYYDIQSIDAAPPAPGTILPAGYVEEVQWDSNPSDQGVASFTGGAVYFNNINSNSLTLQLAPGGVTPLILMVGFDTSGPDELIGTGQLAGILTNNLTAFSLTLRLTLTLDATRSRIDAMSWVKELTPKPDGTFPTLTFTPLPSVPPQPQSVLVSGTFLGQAQNFTGETQDAAIGTLIDQVCLLTLTTQNADDPGGAIRQNLRGKIFSALADVDPLTGTSQADGINELVNSWLLGGITDLPDYGVIPGGVNGQQGDNTCKVAADVTLDDQGENLLVKYLGPQYTFQFSDPGWPPPSEIAPAAPGALSSIDHIVVLMMENRSFDHMLGYLSLPVSQGGMGRADIDGLRGNESNSLLDGTLCPSTPFQTGETVFAPDPPHGTDPVARAINGGKMDGFAREYAYANGPVVGPNIMKYHTGANLPAYDAMARDFAICQRWFASHPGPTFCNRFHMLTGRLNIDPYGFWELGQSSPLRPAFTDTIFDHLTAAGVTWKYFESNYCYPRLFERHTFDNANIFDFDDPGLGFLNVAASGLLPSVTFIDPHFIELPPGGNCDGPPADVAQGQKLVQQVVEAVVTSPNWSSTMLIVVYDEHGGFYDHVPPPAAAQVAPGLPTTYGVRVPAFVVSPWVAGGTVFGNDSNTSGPAGPATYFDHTSILKTIARRFLNGSTPTNPPPDMGARYAAANDLSSIISSQPRTSPFLPFIAYNLVFSASQKRLEVQDANAAPGTILLQDDPQGTVAQQFSFEDAGNGYFYIRTHTGSLYLTVDVPPPGSGTPQSYSVKQDVKYTAGGADGNNPNYQIWSLLIFEPSEYPFTVQTVDIGCPAFKDWGLQPLGGSLQSGTPIVLALETSVSGLGVIGTQRKYSWAISRYVQGKLVSGVTALSFLPQQVGDVNARTAQSVTLTVSDGSPLIVYSVAITSDTGARRRLRQRSASRCAASWRKRQYSERAACCRGLVPSDRRRAASCPVRDRP